MAVTILTRKQIPSALVYVDAINTFTQPQYLPITTPVLDTEAANKKYVDDSVVAASTGLKVKESVRATTTISSGTYNATGGASARGQLTAAPSTIDGVPLSVGNRILVKDHSTPAANGIYTVTTVGTGATGIWDRATDFDADAEVTSNAFCFVEEGAVASDTAWVLTTNNPITIGGAVGTPLTFTQFAGAGVGVSTISIVTANGVSGTSSGGSTPALTLASALGVGVVRSNGIGAFLLGAVDLAGAEVTGTLPVSRGGAGVATLTGLSYGNGTSPRTAASAAQVVAVIGSTNVLNATNTDNTLVVNDTTTAATMYPTWVTATAGDLPTKVSSTKLSFVPSTGILSATGFAGSGAGLTGLAPGSISGTLITLGSTVITAGSVTTVLAGLSSVTSTTFVGALSGNASTSSSAAVLTTARTIAISGGVTGTATSFNGGANITIPITAMDASSLSTGTVPDARISGSYTGMVNLTGSGSVDFANFLGLATDTVTTPSFTWTGDLTTGLYRPTTSQIAVAIAGVQRVLFSATGIVVTGSVQATSFIGNVTGSAASFTGSLSGDVTGTQSATAISSTVVTGKLITGFSSTTGTVSATDTILVAINKLNGNIGSKQNTISSTNFKVGVAVIGAANGTNLAFTLANTPILATEAVYVNGVIQQRGAGNDYQISGVAVTFEAGNAPQVGAILVASYFV
jgi:hypothetical protein